MLPVILAAAALSPLVCADPDRIKGETKIAERIVYASDINAACMSLAQLRTWIQLYQEKIGSF